MATEDNGPKYILPVVKVPFINTFNVERNSFKYNKIYIDIANKKILSEVDIYSSNINGRTTNQTPNPPLMYVTSSHVSIDNEDFDKIFNTELFNNYVYSIYKFTKQSDGAQPIYSGVSNITSNQYPYVSEKSINNIEIKNIIIDLNSDKYYPTQAGSIGNSPIQIKFDAILYQFINAIPKTLQGGPIPPRKEITATVTNVAPLVWSTGQIIFNLERFYSVSADYALKKYNRYFYTVIGKNPFNMTQNPELNNYKYVVFPNNGSYTFESNIDELHYIIVGGGGAGGRSAKIVVSHSVQGGGAGGDIKHETVRNIKKDFLLIVTVGSGGLEGGIDIGHRGGTSGGSTSFTILDLNSDNFESQLVCGGPGGGGSESEEGMGGKFKTGKPGRGSSKVSNMFSTDTEFSSSSEQVIFKDGSQFTWTFSGGGGAGGYGLTDQNLSGAKIGYTSAGVFTSMGSGGRGVENAGNFNNTQNGQDIKRLINGQFSTISSGCGGGGGGTNGGKGSNGFAMFYWITQ